MSNHKELLINLLGSTYSELKKVEGSVVDGSRNLVGRSDTIKEELHKIVNKPESFQPPVNPVPITQENTPVPVPVLVSGQEEETDPRQLTFDFEVNEKELLFKKIALIEKKIDKIISLLEDE